MWFENEAPRTIRRSASFITQLATGMEIPIAHTVELLDWAYGGPVPRGLEALEKFVSDVPKPKRTAEDYIGT